MKKIMFNDKFGLTQAVLEGRKTMTRRAIKEMTDRKYKKLPQVQENCNDGSFLVFKDADDLEPIILYPKYKVGEIVAVAQSYHFLNKSGYVAPEWLDHYCEDSAGYKNKMFVRADLMPHHVRITNVRIERLQNISDEDCFREGVYKKTLCPPGDIDYYYHSEPRCKWEVYPSARAAFAGLIDKVSSKGTWERNPWVFVYEFELVR